MASFSNRFDRMEEIMGALKHENKELKSTLADRDRELFSMRDRLNELEQYGRNWSVRILNLQIPAEEASDPRKVMNHVFNRVLLPIFTGAVERGELQCIPHVNDILETAHILPAKPDQINTIIARFFSRNIRNLVFRLKKEFAPRERADPASRQGGAHQRPTKFLHPIYEDLTRPAFHKMRALNGSDLVESCWSVNGIIKYKLKNCQDIKKVKSVYMSLEEIIG